MAAPLEPPALDGLVDLAERSRVDDWSLRSSLCRYAQPEPTRVAAVLSLVRRWEAAVHDHLPVLRRDGARYLVAAGLSEEGSAGAGDGVDGPRTDSDDGAASDLDPFVVDLLRVGAVLDGAGDVVAAWAVDRTGDPSAALDDVVEQVTTELDRLGVAEEAPIPRGMRGRG